MLNNRNSLILAWGLGHLVAQFKFRYLDTNNFESSHALDLVGVNVPRSLFKRL
jgi:hypothetical protein